MAGHSNVPNDLQESIRNVLDRHIKLSIKRLVKQEVRPDKWENKVLAFSTSRLFIFTGKAPTKVENSIHYLDIQSVESKKPSQLVLTVDGKPLSFYTMETETEEVDHMICHIGTSLKTTFPAFPLERVISKIEVHPPERLRLMNDMVQNIEKKEMGPCGNFSVMYTCMCDYYNLPYREEVSWDVDTIYLSQDSRELCLRDFDHLNSKDLVPIVAALEHNPWFTSLNASNVYLVPEVSAEILRVMKKNAVIEELLLCNTGITTEFITKLATAILSNSDTQLHKIDVSNNVVDEKCLVHLVGSLKSRGRCFTYLDLSRTKLSTKGLNRVAEIMSQSPNVFSGLQVLKLAELSSGKSEDLQALYSFLAQPMNITHLDVSGTECALDQLIVPLQRGCSMTMSHLYLARTTFTNKKLKDAQVPPSWKQFFSMVMNLKHLDMSGVKMPAEALKELLLGLGSNRNLSGLHLNISGLDLTNQAFQYLQNCLSAVTTIYSLDVSNISLNETDLCTLLSCIGQNKEIKHLYIGRLINNMKPKNLNTVLEGLVHLIQDEDSSLESLSLADSKLKTSMNMIINSLGSNTSLTEIDISGNQMGDLGARMLAKALQINNKLKVINWDNNNTTAQGFEDIAAALEKNYTVKKMPIPVRDASAALKQPERTEAALQKIESLLQRNHSPRKYSSDQAYRLQQGFLISSTQQMVDRRVVQTQDTINALSVESTEAIQDDVDKAKSLIKDADNLKVLLPKLHDIANASQNSGNPVELKLKHIAKELREVLEEHMNKTVSDMVASSCRMCFTVTSDESFLAELKEGCAAKSAIPKDFTSNILDGVDTDIYNKLSELNLAVAAHISDQVIDRVIERLSERNKTLTNHLNQRIKNPFRHSQTKPEKMDNDSEKMEEVVLRPSSSPQESPSIAVMRKSIHERKRRPQSVITPQPTTLPVIPDKEEDSSNHVIREDDDLVLDLPQEAKLGNYKRAKPPARSRPTVRPTAPVNQEKPGDSFKEDEGIDQFFGSTPVSVSATGSPSTIANKKSPMANPRRSKMSSRKPSETEEEKKKDDKQDNKRGSKPTPPAASAKPKVTISSQESKKEEILERRPKELETEVEEQKKFEKKEEILEETKKTESSVEFKPPQILEKPANALEKEPGEITKTDGEKTDETKKEQEQPDKEKTEEVAPKVPLVVPKRPLHPGMGFGGNILAQVKAEQEKRKSLMPNTNISLPVKSPVSEKEVPLFPRNLKPVNDKATVSPQSDEKLTQENGNKKPIGDGVPKSPLNKIRVPQSAERLTQENGSKKSVGDGGPMSPLNKLRFSDKSVPISKKPLDSVQDTIKSTEIPKTESCPDKEEKKTIATDDDIEKVKDATSSRIDIISPGSQKDSDGSNANSHGKSDQKPPPALRPRPQIKTAKPKSFIETEVKPNEKEPEKEKHPEEKPKKKEHEEKEKQKHPEEKPNEKEHEEEKKKHPEEKTDKKEHEEGKQKHPEEKPSTKEHEEKEKKKHPEEKPNKKEHEEKQKHPEDKPSTKEHEEKEKKKHLEEKPNKKEHEEKQKHTEEKPNKKEHEEKQKHPEGKPDEKDKEEKQKHQESRVVYDSATIRLSLKEKMALFAEQNIEDKPQKPEKSNSLPRGVKPPEQIDEKRPSSMFLPMLAKRDGKNNSKKSEEKKVEVKEEHKSASDEDVSSESDSETFKTKSGLRSSASSPDSAKCPDRDSSSSEEVIMV
ncbi:hypothetical protein ACJMK2_009925 [Sinanodonta woodiana]|uniref:F-actin-uncapping protein LRRC16A n=1 Tax=Sinanodonta woodiana TaxID=1069815 RepID=A0ABD3VDR9_SINWO